MAQDIVLTGVINYPNLFVPRQINGRGDPKYSASLILDPSTNWQEVDAAIQEAARNRFPKGIPQDLRTPLKSAEDDGFPGQWKLNAYSDRAPGVVDQQVQPLLDASQIFSGCKVRMHVRFFGYNTAGNRGVGVGLNNVQLLDNVNVKRLDSQKDAKSVFQPVEGAPAQLSPTAYSSPAQPGPVQLGPVQPGPAPTGPAQPGPVQPGPVQSGPAPTGPAQPGPVQPGPVQSGPAQTPRAPAPPPPGAPQPTQEQPTEPAPVDGIAPPWDM